MLAVGLAASCSTSLTKRRLRRWSPSAPVANSSAAHVITQIRYQVIDSRTIDEAVCGGMGSTLAAQIGSCQLIAWPTALTYIE